MNNRCLNVKRNFRQLQNVVYNDISWFGMQSFKDHIDIQCLPSKVNSDELLLWSWLWNRFFKDTLQKMWFEVIFSETGISGRKEKGSDETGQILNWYDLMPNVLYTYILLMYLKQKPREIEAEGLWNIKINLYEICGHYEGFWKSPLCETCLLCWYFSHQFGQW